jgi:hypothetical protein
MCWQATQTYPCDQASPRRARAFVIDQFTAALGTTTLLGDVPAAAEVVTSELITNAVNAQCSRTRLTLAIHRDRASIAVQDDAPGEPVPRHPGPRDARGRGLQVVEGLARRWGVDPVPGGKRVWAEFELPAEATRALACHAR